MPIKTFCYINSKLCDEKLASISINERGFMFGDGIFESCHIRSYQILDFKQHKERLEQGLKALKIETDITDLEKKSQLIIKKNNIENGILRISISRGLGSKGYLPSYESEALTVIQTKIPTPPPAKIRLGIAKNIKLSSCSNLAQHKTMNSLNYILAKIEAQENNVFDSILLNDKGFICETSSANIFWVKGNKIYTPQHSCGLVLGTKRQKIIEIISQNTDFELIAGQFTIDDLKDCQELFLTNSNILILPANELQIADNIINFRQTKISQQILTKLLDELSNTA